MAPSRGLGASRLSMRVQLAAVALLAGGVGVGVASFLPAYLGGSSLAAQPDLATAHAVTLAGFALAAVLTVFAGRPGTARRAPLGLPGVLGIGVAAVDLGLVITDLGQAVSGARAGGGLVLTVVEWALCAAGSVLALHPILLRPDRAGEPRVAAARRRPDLAGGLVVTATGLAAAGLFAPAWDRYVVHLEAIGRVTTFTAGDAFAEPGVMIAGSVVVMVAVAAVAAAAGFLRQAKVAATLLAGAVVVLVGEIASALVQSSQPVAPRQLGLSAGRASALGLHVDAGFTAVFYLFCVFVALLAALAATRASAVFRLQPATGATGATGVGTPAPPPWAGPGVSAGTVLPPPAGVPLAPPGSYPSGYALAGYGAPLPAPPSSTPWEVHGWQAPEEPEAPQAPQADAPPTWTPPVHEPAASPQAPEGAARRPRRTPHY